MKKGKKLAISIVIAIILVLIAEWFLMIPLNVRSIRFWMLLVVVFAFLAVFNLSFQMPNTNEEKPMQVIVPSGARKTFTILALISAAIMVLGTVSGFKIFHSSAYASMMNVDQADISEYDITLNDVPLLDKDSAYLLANRKMGTLVDLVSQFSLGEASNTQINYKNAPVRVVPLEYAGFLKFWGNKSDGIPGYVIVDMATQKAELINVEGGIEYSPSAYFEKNLRRHVFFHYPTKMVDSYTFEIDEEGNPYWIIRTVKKTIGLFDGTDMSAVLAVNAVTGEITEYPIDNVPTWIDTAYPANLVINQYDNYGTLRGGYWNSIFGQKNVVETTDGYNYIAFDDDIYLYTGITSVVSDESNIGFVFINMRTKQVKQYTLASAEEYSAMSSAEGQVQHLGYTATFPILVRVAGQPTYCMALKDAGGLIKLYAMVNAEQYQVVATGASINETMKQYVNIMADNGIQYESIDYVDETTAQDGGEEMEKTEIRAEITEIKSANISGTTYFYLKLKEQDAWFEIPATDKMIIFAEVGQTITLSYNKNNIEAEKIISAELK